MSDADAAGGSGAPAPLGVLRPASASALAPLRAPVLDIPMREPLRWLTSPPPPPHAPPHDAAGGSADGADADAAAGGAGDFVYVAFADDEHVRLDAGAAFEFAVRACRAAPSASTTRAGAMRRIPCSARAGVWQATQRVCTALTCAAREQELHTDAPTLRLEDGSTFVGARLRAHCLPLDALRSHTRRTCLFPPQLRFARR
jgi:hypothetical protein